MISLLPMVLRTSIILALGIIAAVALRRRSAATRHWVLAVSMCCAGAAPLVAFVVPVWTIPALTRSTVADTHVEMSVRQRTGGDAVAPASFPAPAPQSRVSFQRLENTIVVVWIAAALVKLVVLVAGLLRLSRLKSTCTPWHSTSVTESLQHLSTVFDVRRIALMRTDRPALVVTWGVLSPTVVLPPDAERWPRARVDVVLAHEVAHVVRRDWVVQIAAEVLKAIYWFNPLFWIACARLRHASECACDDAVVSAGIDSRRYASELLEVARSFGRNRHQWLPAPAMVERSSNLERRVRAMLNTGIDRNPITPRARWMGALALVAVTLPIASFAQTTFVTLSGAIVDQHDRVLPNTTMTLNDGVRHVKHETQTDANGRFEFIGLPAGDYTYTAKQVGFRDLAGSLTLGGQTVSRTLKMEVGTLQETIFVASSDGAITSAHQRGALAAKRPIDRCAASTTAGGNIRAPHKVKDVAPGYPGVDGRIELAATIGTDGSVVDVQVVKSDRPELVSAAIDAVRQWEFDATLLNCVPIEVQMNVSVAFGKQ